MNSNLQSRTQEYSLLPRLDISLSESNIPHLTMPCELNFNYYTSETFDNDNDIIECFNELISESSTLDIRDLKFGILLMSPTKKLLDFQLKKKLKIRFIDSY